MTNFLVTPPVFEDFPVFLVPTLYQNLSTTTPLLKAVGPGEAELAACEFLYNIHPELYREERLTFELNSEEALRYRLFLRAIDDSLCEFRTLITSFFSFLDPTEAPYPILPLLSPIVGVDFNFDVPEEVARREVVNAIFLWERKGTRDNTIDWIEFITGFRVHIREFYKEVFRTNVWGQSYHTETVITTPPVVWRESWDTFLPVPSYSRSRVLPPTVWVEEWERFVPGDPYATLPHLDEHHRTNTWDGTNTVRPFYNFHFDTDINYGTHGFTQTRQAIPDEGVILPGFLFRNHIGVYIDVPESDLVDTVDTDSTFKPLTTVERINTIVIETGLRVLFIGLTGDQSTDNDQIWEATVSLDGDVTWSLHTITASEIGIDFVWFNKPFLDIILNKVGRILDLITLYGVVNHLFWRLIYAENAYLCHQYEYTVVPRLLEGWGEHIGDDVELPPDVESVIQTTQCDAVAEESFACFGDTYNIDIGGIVCCDSSVSEDSDENGSCEGRLATFAFCTNNPESLTNEDSGSQLWLTFYPAKYWSHQVDDILQEWTPDTDGSLTNTTVIPADYTLAELFIDPLIGTGIGQGIENPTTISSFITDLCISGVFDTIVLEEEWNSPFTETLVVEDTWEITETFEDTLVLDDEWELPAFEDTLVLTDDWDYDVIFDETFELFDDWEDNLPALIPDNDLWLDGNNGPLGNSPVETWLDRSGNDNDALQTIALDRPDHTAHDAGFGNFGTVTFDGINDYMVVSNDTMSNTDQFTFYLVGQWTDPTNFATFISKVVDETLTAGGWGLTQQGASGNTLRFFVDNFNTHYIDYTLPNNTPVILKCEYDQTELKMWANGVPITSAFSLYGGGITNSNTDLHVGAYLNLSTPPVSGFLAGVIAEFIYYGHALTPPEELSLWLYLSAKYDIAVTTEFPQFTETWDYDITYTETTEVAETFNFAVTYDETAEVTESFDVTLSYSESDEVAEGWDLSGDTVLLVAEDWELVSPGDEDDIDPLGLIHGHVFHL